MNKKISLCILFAIFSIGGMFGAESSNVKTVFGTSKNEISTFSSDKKVAEAALTESQKQETEKEKTGEKEKASKKEVEEIESEKNNKSNKYEELFNKSSAKFPKLEFYGKEILNGLKSSIQLPTEVEAGKEYTLSVGDILKIRLFGDTFPQDLTVNDYEIPISVSGTISIPIIGAFNLRGKNIMDSEKEINAKGQLKYKDFKVDIALAKMRSTRIFVMGEVEKPGTYILNPLSNLINAIFIAGGITDNSSIRNVKILRNNKTITVDLYDYFINGKIQDVNTILQEGDTVYIPIAEKTVSIRGKVKKEAKYELKNEKTVEDIIKLAGGYSEKAALNDIKIITVDDEKVRIKEVRKEYVLNNNDYIIIGGINENITNSINIIGNVIKPGLYEMKNGDTLNDIINKSGGLLPNTYLKRIDIINGDVDTKSIKNSYEYGKDNPELHAGDDIYVYSIDDVGENVFISIGGAVKNPDTYKIYKNSKLMDAVFLAKGFLDEDVFLNRADIIRMENDGTKNVIKVDLLAAKDGSGLDNVLLKNYDKIIIYKRSDVEKEKHVQVIGAVKKQGTYALNKGNDKVSDILFEARGLKEKDVYMNKASVIRSMENGELRLININLSKALQGDDNENIELKDFDVLKIYTYDEAVQKSKINIYGDVREPGSYDYYAKMTLDDIVFLAKNFDVSADLDNIEILRVNIKNGNLETIKVSYNQNPQFELSEFDQVFIRKKSNWEEKRIVKISGRVNYPGEYQVSGKETLNSIIKRFGGFKEEAFPENTKIIRKGRITETLENMNKRITDGLKTVNVSGTAINLSYNDKETKEISNLGYNKSSGKYKNDIVLEDSDEIVIPSYPSTVKIVGEVYFPREVGYEEGKGSFDYYLDSAGGFTGKALKEEVFVVKNDGKVKKNGLLGKVNIEAGDTIVVPYDPRIKKEFDFMEESLKIMQWFVTALTAYKLIN